MALPPRILMNLDATLDLHEGRFFVSCFGERVPAELIAALTVHGTASNTATVAIASPVREQPSMAVRIEHWDAPARELPGGDSVDWTVLPDTRLCVDTSGTVQLFSPAGAEQTQRAIEFPIARGFYELQAAYRTSEGLPTWQIRLWDSAELDPDLAEIDRIARLAR